MRHYPQFTTHFTWTHLLYHRILNSPSYGHLPFDGCDSIPRVRMFMNLQKFRQTVISPKTVHNLLPVLNRIPAPVRENLLGCLHFLRWLRHLLDRIQVFQRDHSRVFRRCFRCQLDDNVWIFGFRGGRHILHWHRGGRRRLRSSFSGPETRCFRIICGH